MRVVIVDDEADFRRMLRLQLELEAGWDVVGEAANGREALVEVDRTRPDAVIMDLLMPVMNGFDAIAALRERGRLPVIVAHTAVAGGYARDRIEGLDVPLVLKSGGIDNLVSIVLDEISRSD